MLSSNIQSLIALDSKSFVVTFVPSKFKIHFKNPLFKPMV